MIAFFITFVEGLINHFGKASSTPCWVWPKSANSDLFLCPHHQTTTWQCKWSGKGWGGGEIEKERKKRHYFLNVDLNHCSGKGKENTLKGKENKKRKKEKKEKEG